MKNISLITSIALGFCEPGFLRIVPPSMVIAATAIPGLQQFVRLPLTHGTGNFKEVYADGEEGEVYVKSIHCRIPRLYPAMDAQLQRLKRKALACLITDVNGFSILVHPLELSFTRSNPGEAGSYRGYELSLTGTSHSPSPYVSGLTQSNLPSMPALPHEVLSAL